MTYEELIRCGNPCHAATCSLLNDLIPRTATTLLNVWVYKTRSFPGVDSIKSRHAGRYLCSYTLKLYRNYSCLEGQYRGCLLSRVSPQELRVPLFMPRQYVALTWCSDTWDVFGFRVALRSFVTIFNVQRSFVSIFNVQRLYTTGEPRKGLAGLNTSESMTRGVYIRAWHTRRRDDHSYPIRCANAATAT